jgi:membrane-bound lytic murein transglycosylase D
VKYSLDLRLVADIVNAPIDELMALNPSILRMDTPPGVSFDLHLPAGAADLFQKRIALVPEQHRNAWRYHRIAADDTLATIAHSYRISESELAEANQLREGRSLTGVDGVVVPLAPVVERTSHAVLYTARRGDTLVSIADRFGVSLDQLRRWNSIASGVNVAPGRKLHVAEPASAAHASAKHRADNAPSTTRNGNTAANKKKSPQK